MPLVEAHNLSKDYLAGDITVNAIRGFDFTIESSSFISFVGPSSNIKLCCP